MRLFTAINYNDEVKAYLADIQNRLKKYALKGNFSLYDNLHLTLVFIGEVSDNVQLLKKAMDDVSILPFSMTISGIGHFKRDRGDIWWAGIEKNRSLNELQSQLSANISSVGFPIEKRRFNPHLTLARGVRLRDDFEPNLLNNGVSRIKTQVSRISLMKSHRVDGALTYTEIYDKDL